MKKLTYIIGIFSLITITSCVEEVDSSEFLSDEDIQTIIDEATNNDETTNEKEFIEDDNGEESMD